MVYNGEQFFRSRDIGLIPRSLLWFIESTACFWDFNKEGLSGLLLIWEESFYDH